MKECFDISIILRKLEKEIVNQFYYAIGSAKIGREGRFDQGYFALPWEIADDIKSELERKLLIDNSNKNM